MMQIMRIYIFRAAIIAGLFNAGIISAGPSAGGTEAKRLEASYPICVPTNGQVMCLTICEECALEFVWVERLKAWVSRRPVSRGEYHHYRADRSGPEEGQPAPQENARQPVAGVSFKEAENYAAWVNARARAALPLNAVVSLPRAGDMVYLNAGYRWEEKDEPSAWLKCYGLHCSAVPDVPFMTIGDVTGKQAEGSPDEAPGQVVLENRMREWTAEDAGGLQVMNGPTLMQLLEEYATFKYSYSDNAFLDASVKGALLGFRLVIRQ